MVDASPLRDEWSGHRRRHPSGQEVRSLRLRRRRAGYPCTRFGAARAVQLSPRASRTGKGAPVARPSGDERAEAIAASLAPFDWRSFTDRMLARRVIAAVDELTVLRLVGALPGVDVGAVDSLEPADPSDERVDVLV